MLISELASKVDIMHPALTNPPTPTVGGFSIPTCPTSHCAKRSRKKEIVIWGWPLPSGVPAGGTPRCCLELEGTLIIPTLGLRGDWDTPQENRWERGRIKGEQRGTGWGQRSATGRRVAAAPSRAATTMLSCLCTSAQASDPASVSLALEQALARPGNVATELERGAQSTWLMRNGQAQVSGGLSLD